MNNMNNTKKKLTQIEKNFLKSLNRNALSIKKQQDKINDKINKFIEEHKGKYDELDKMLISIDETVKSYTDGLTFDEYFNNEIEISEDFNTQNTDEHIEGQGETSNLIVDVQEPIVETVTDVPNMPVDVDYTQQNNIPGVINSEEPQLSL